MTDAGPLDIWARWLLERRHGGDPDRLRQMLEFLAPVRDRVLDNAGVHEGDVVLDVGCGDGLMGFGALARVGATGRVIFSDISNDLLEHVERLARDGRLTDRCRFVRADAADLSSVADESVDVVTTRSVLIYVKDKRAAFRSFQRVLRDGGRFSLFEPINAFPRGRDPWSEMWDVAGVRDVVAKLRTVYERIQPPDDPMIDFDEHDLFVLARDAGFTSIRLELEAKLEPPRLFSSVTWEGYIHSSWNPRVPTLAEAMAQVLTDEERERYTAHIRPQLASGSARPITSAVAYIWGHR